MNRKYDVMGIGNAIVDVLSETNDNFLDIMGIEKGIMQLVEKERAETLYAAMDERTQAPGGSVANTLAALGNLGLSTGFIGRVRNDALGRFYAAGMEDDGTSFINPPVEGADLPTSRSMIFVTEDGERSMNTYLGISSELGPDDVDQAQVEQSYILFLEGYLYDKDSGKAAFELAAETAHKVGGHAGISLSDPFCVTRHRVDFQRLVNSLDYVIGNQEEWEALYETNVEEALEYARRHCPLVVCTRSGDGVTLIRGEERVEIEIEKIVPVDATGAGDGFAAGFIYGLANDCGLELCGRMGAAVAAEVIRQIGPRPKINLKHRFETLGLL
ncbi:adenosine kinase [Halovulum sp. GXIMD14793]